MRNNCWLVFWLSFALFFLGAMIKCLATSETDYLLAVLGALAMVALARLGRAVGFEVSLSGREDAFL